MVTNSTYVLEFIKQRMRDLGYDDYTWKAIRLKPSDDLGGVVNVFEQPAYNEYYYLVSAELAGELVIVGDTSVFNESVSDYANFNYYQIREFTGLIRIQSPIEDIDLEFIVATPRIPRSKETTDLLRGLDEEAPSEEINQNN